MNLNVEIADEIGAALEARAQAQGITPDHVASQVLTDALAGEVKAAETFAQARQPSVSASIRHLWKDFSDEERADYPEGGAYQIDHHVYGSPKR